MSDKIHDGHRQRDAYVYVRQSSVAQVRQHQESQARQRGLVRRAAFLGWPRERIHVIDEDLGVSAESAHNRTGFTSLLSEVYEHRAGLILCTEASRLARNNSDWYRLLSMCAHRDVLLADEHRVYDPAHRDDRVVLGLQGTMAEYELDVLRQRAQESKVRKAERGELYSNIAAGYVLTSDGQLDLDPNRRVQQAVRRVFQQFRECSSVRELYRWVREREMTLPTYRGRAGQSELDWRVPCYQRLLDMLQNPIYAGAYAYGRRTTVVDMTSDGDLHKRPNQRLPQREWAVLIPDHHPGYLSWDEYERNQTKIGANANMRGRMVKRAVQQGEALLAGLVRCGHCGHKVLVRYSRGQGRYCCDGPADQRHGSGCFTCQAEGVDASVGAAVLEAVRPAGVAAAARAQQQLAQAHRQEREALVLERDQAQYEADRARRQFDRVEPENRLVATELERRWNDKLTALTAVESRLAELDDRCDQVDPDDVAELRELGAHVERVWRHPEADMKLKKRVVRAVVHEVIAQVDEPTDTIQLRVHWAGGCHTQLGVPRRRSRSRLAIPDLTDAVRTLALVADDAHVAQILNRGGIRTSKGNTWTARRVASFRRSHGIPAFREGDKIEHGLLLQCEAATRVGISAMSIHRLVQRRILPAEQPVAGLPCIIRESDLARPEVQRAIKATKQARDRPLTEPPNQQTLF